METEYTKEWCERMPELEQTVSESAFKNVVSAALCNSCGATESVSQISKTCFICFACAVAQGRRMTDAWLGDYCEDDNTH